MNLDYSNPEENILFATFESDLKDHNSNEFTVVGSAPIFREDPVVGKYMEVPEKSYLTMVNDGFAVGTGDFTLDFWSYSIGNYCAVSTASRSKGISIAPNFLIELRPLAYVGDINQKESIKLPSYKKNEWAHYSLVRKDGVCYAFVNGVFQGKVNSVFNVTTKSLAINNEFTDNSAGTFCDLNNYYKAVRFCNFARWTEDFIPPNPISPVENSFIITEKYQDQAGNQLKPDITKTVADEQDFTTSAPNISGYKVTGYKIDNSTLVSGNTVTLLSVKTDHIITFIYEVDEDNGGNEVNNGKCCCCCTNIFHIYTCCSNEQKIKDLVNEIKCKCRCD